MLKVYGKDQCGRCDMVQNLLKNKGVEFEYSKLDSLSNDEKIRLMAKARDCGKMELPLMVEDGQFKSITDF